jgi:hypothetical protein
MKHDRRTLDTPRDRIRFHPLESKRFEIEIINGRFDHPGRVVFSDIVVKSFRK